MTIRELVLLAAALSMDAFAVAVSMGCCLRTPRLGHALRPACAFGFFQFFMPVLGWYLGLSVRSFIESWDHWAAFVLLAWIGGGMIRESFGKDEDEACPVRDPLRWSRLFPAAVATSIDALAVGLSLSVLHLPIWGPALLIGVVCALLTAVGFLLGARLNRAARLGKQAERIGGAILLLIGIKILAEHGVFSRF